MLWIFIICVAVAMAAIIAYPLERSKAAALLFTILTISSVGLYAVLGNPNAQQQIDQHYAKVGHAKARISILEAQVGDTIEPLLELAQHYGTLQQWPKAADTYRRASLISNGNPKILTAYAEALIFSEDGTISKHAKQALDMAALQTNALPEIEYYNAIYLLQQGDAEPAMAKMKKLYNSLENSHPLKQRINTQIGRSQ